MMDFAVQLYDTPFSQVQSFMEQAYGPPRFVETNLYGSWRWTIRCSGDWYGDSVFWEHERSRVCLFTEADTMMTPNEALAAHPAMSFLLHAGCQWRGVAEVRCWLDSNLN